ncbi:MAG: YeeE/YedE family protein [Eubacteriales bacterium]
MDIITFLFREPWPWWLGGIIIGLMVPVMYYFLNTPLGVSTGFGNITKMIFRNTKLKWLKSDNFKDVFNWRTFFIAGIVIGGFLSARAESAAFLTQAMGKFTELSNWPFAAVVIWFLCGGFLLGLGARIAGGCTSGHSIHGIANFHLSSVIATIFFMLAGAITVFLIRVLILGGTF